MNDSQLKAMAAVVISLAGCIVVMTDAGQYVAACEFGGIVIDFGDKNVAWTVVNFDEHFTAVVDSLDYICERNGYSYSLNKNEDIVEIDNTYSVPGDAIWGLWVVEQGKTEWVKISAPYVVDLSDYVISSWAYCGLEQKPTVAVDQSGKSIYGYDGVQRIVSLAPSITEIVSDMKATELLVGVDRYSDYPNEIVRMRDKGDVVTIGDYGTPVFEEIISVKPNVVLCDGFQYSHVQLSDRLRSSGSDAKSVVLCTEGTFDDVVDSMYVVGVVLGRSDDANFRIKQIEKESLKTISLMQRSETFNYDNIMIVLGSNTSPFVAGNHTYVGDVVSRLSGKNAFVDFDGWLPVNRELIVESDPSRIVILMTDREATQFEYDSMLSMLPYEWKSTKAYQDGEVYMICENAGDMMQRPSPRIIQLMELLGRILHPEVYHLTEMPKYIGDNYADLLM